jgi:hypothetical protein
MVWLETIAMFVCLCWMLTWEVSRGDSPRLAPIRSGQGWKPRGSRRHA